jgi:hypothetical protein
MPSRPRVPHRSLRPLNRIRRVDLDSSPSAVVAGSTFLLVVDLHNIPLAVAPRPSLGCRVAADIHTVLAVHTGLVGHHNPHLVLAVGKGRFGFEVVVIQGPSNRTDRHRSALVEDR